MRQKIRRAVMNLGLIGCAGLVMGLSIWGPETLARYQDRSIIDQPHTLEGDGSSEGYRYKLSSNEKLYILSECMNSQSLPESEYNALTRRTAAEVDYAEPAGGYAFVVNNRGVLGSGITAEEIYESCNQGLDMLKAAGVLPSQIREVTAGAYDRVLYSAIDVSRNNFSVWKLSLATSRKNANKENRLMDAYIDADDGKIYEFYVRTELSWSEIDPDAIIAGWSEYIGLEAPEPYEGENQLMETASYYRKYRFDGIGNDATIVTIGFYEGINELFLKITR